MWTFLNSQADGRLLTFTWNQASWEHRRMSQAVIRSTPDRGQRLCTWHKVTPKNNHSSVWYVMLQLCVTLSRLFSYMACDMIWTPSMFPLKKTLKLQMNIHFKWSWTNKSQFTATKKDLDLRDTVKHKWHKKWPSRPTSSDAGSVDGHHHRFGTLQKEKVYLYSYF